MQAERIFFLKEAIKEDPNEAFNYYALGLEYKKSDPKQASELFNYCLQHFPRYLATYYTAANHFFDQNDMEMAAMTFLRGIALAKELGNEKALKELQGSYQMFLNETED